MQDRKLDISRIQETKVDTGETIELNGYVVHFVGCQDTTTADKNNTNNPKG